MGKHLLRFNLKGLEDKVSQNAPKGLETCDSIMAQHFDLHVLSLQPFEGSSNCAYGRDTLTQFGEILFVKDFLLENYDFEGFIRGIGFKGKVLGSIPFSEGGCFIFGDKFCFISDIFEEEKEIIQFFLKEKCNFGIPFYFLPSLSTAYNGHIDLDYQIIDQARLIYFTNSVVGLDSERKAITTLKKISREQDYSLREYKRPQNTLKMNEFLHYTTRVSESVVRLDNIPMDQSLINDFFMRWNGINSITQRNIFSTFYIDPSEKSFLEENGMNIIEAPYGRTNIAAGLRCVYGEFTV